MATGILGFIPVINGWTKFETDAATVTSWVRMFEERANEELRHKDMIIRKDTTSYDASLQLPSDWLEFDYIRRVGDVPLRYLTKDEYFQHVAADASTKAYTIVGDYALVNPAPDPVAGQEFEIAYYARLTPLDVSDTPFYTKYPRLYTFGTLAMSAPYLEEDERFVMWEGQTAQLIARMNESSKRSQYSGSPLVKRARTFG